MDLGKHIIVHHPSVSHSIDPFYLADVFDNSLTMNDLLTESLVDKNVHAFFMLIILFCSCQIPYYNHFS
ncbi:hypothetical protein BCR42DRAFT_419660 [Absidia repens]|uniref:Uncharacterized protein n=1 Tax=Absidia repens TaxID=90262 RepID=A0A1X2IA63_9FUNG|nr:hypothetical protein BCR42DRAFT_419660 [Absidia repens]